MTIEKLNFDDLEDVTGGFEETNPALPTWGLNIKCPKCHNERASGFATTVFHDPKTDSVEYHCSCGCQFVCVGENVFYRQKWIDICSENKYKYPFQ